jgi:hypothetical protein
MLTIRESDLKGICAVTKDRESSLYTLKEKNEIDTPYGTYIPQYSGQDVREKYNGSISLYHSGTVRSIALEKMSYIESPIGILPAEFIMFYESGALKRVFPLNGKITAFWTEEDEGELCPVLTVPTKCGIVSSKLINVTFYESGAVRSVTMWPGERAEIDTPVGKVKIRIGFSLHEDGSLRSFEPARVTLLDTKIGKISAFDMMALGINADEGSIMFSPSGELVSLRTVDNRIKVIHDGREETISPVTHPSMTSDVGTETDPLTITFENGHVILNNGETKRFPIENSKFIVERHIHADILSISNQ